MTKAPTANEKQVKKVIQLLEEQLAHSNQQNEELSKQIESLTQQVQHLTRMLFGSKTEKSKYQTPDGQGSLFDDDSTFTEPEHTGEQSQETITYTVDRKSSRKKRNASLHDDVAVEMIHYHPESTVCDCCQDQMTEIGSKMVREEAKFIPASMMKVQHMEHAYECKACKRDVSLPTQIKKGRAPQPAIQRSLAGSSILAKVIYDKFVQYLPLYRQVKEWIRHGLKTNDKNLSNWVIRVAEEWLSPIYERLKELMMLKNVLHVDETYARIIFRSDGKSGQKNAYNWVYRTVPNQGPIITLFQSSLSRARSVLDTFTQDFRVTCQMLRSPIVGHMSEDIG